MADLADLLELAFADSMDANGRLAINEMRRLSHISWGISILNTMSMGLNTGYVWVEDGRLVGNVSVYDAYEWPKSLGAAWIIADVAVHPTFQRRGIARQLLHASMDLIRERGGRYALLQVRTDNFGAQSLYKQLGFVPEREWTTWKRSSLLRVAQRISDGRIHIANRGRDWKREYALAEQVRPAEQGGLGWLRPLHPGYFRRSWWQKLGDMLSLHSKETLVIRNEETDQIDASLHIENGFVTSTRLRLMVKPEYESLYADALLHTAVTRFNRNNIIIEHPADEPVTSEILRHYGFRPHQTLLNMRWDVS